MKRLASAALVTLIASICVVALEGASSASAAKQAEPTISLKAATKLAHAGARRTFAILAEPVRFPNGTITESILVRVAPCRSGLSGYVEEGKREPVYRCRVFDKAKSTRGSSTTCYLQSYLTAEVKVWPTAAGTVDKTMETLYPLKGRWSVLVRITGDANHAHSVNNAPTCAKE